MSDPDDCASQEIEASTSSTSTRNSKMFKFLRSALDANKSHEACRGVKETALFTDGDTKLLELEKREFIKNWILAQENTATSPRRSCPPSPVLGTISNDYAARRSAKYPVIDCQSKRIRQDIDAKENFGISPNNRSWQTLRPPTTARTVVVIEDEEAEVFINSSSNDSDKTCMNSPLKNGNSSTSTLDASGSFCKFLESRADNKRRRSIPESSKIPAALSSSSPVGEFNSERKEASKSFWIAADESPTKLATGRAVKLNARRSYDNSVSREKLSTASPFRERENTIVNKDMKIGEHDRSSLRNFWHAAKESPAAREFRSTLRKNNLQHAMCQSSRLSTAISASSAINGSDRTAVESCTTNPAEEEIKIESDSDDTASDFIENIDTQSQRAISKSENIFNIEDASQVSVERRSKRPRDISCDSDETYYSDGDRAARQRSSLPSSSKDSQRISEAKSDNVISQVASPLEPNFETSAYVARFNNSKEDNKKKKAKKGSLAAKLQALVRLQTSNLRIWRHQMSQPDFKSSRVQFVTLKIRDRETRWGRHYVTATVIADSHCLLKSSFASRSGPNDQVSVSSLEGRSVTLMINPEITGKITIRSNSTLNIYPPWDIMDRYGKILNAVYFDMMPDTDDVDAVGTSEVHTSEIIVQTFDCPCVHANTIVDSCPDKFTDRKPSVTRALFDS